MTKNASEGCCAYSAECRGGEGGLDEVLEIDDTTPVIWVTDSRSLAQALAKGVLLQTGHAEAHIWERLLRLAERGVKVAVTWVFSHCDDCVANELADKLAGEAAKLLHENPSSAPWWYIDAARARYSEVYNAYDKRLAELVKEWPEERVEKDSKLRTLAPLKLSVMSYLPPNLQRVLSCLRSSVSSSISDPPASSAVQYQLSASLAMVQCGRIGSCAHKAWRPSVVI